MQMKSSIKKIKDCRYALNIEVDANEVNACFQEVYVEIGKKAKIPGYRAGKVPKEMIEKTYEAEAKDEVIKSLVSKSYPKALQKHKAFAISFPQIRDLSLEKGKKLKFVAEFDASPEIKLKNYKGLKITRESSLIKDEDIAQTLKSLQESRAELKPIEEERDVKEGDYLVCDVEMVRNGEPGQSQKNATLPIDKSQAEGLWAKHLVGMKKGETREVPWEQANANGKGDGDKCIYKITANELKKKEMPQLNEDFAKGFGKKTIDELKEEIRKDLARYKEHQSRQKMRDQVLEKLAKDNVFTVPESLIEKQRDKLMESKLAYQHAPLDDKKKEELKKESHANAERQVRLYFILNKIAEVESVEADEADVTRRINEMAVQAKASPEEMKKKYEDDVRHEVRQNKTLDQVIAQAKIVEQEQK